MRDVARRKLVSKSPETTQKLAALALVKPLTEMNSVDAIRLSKIFGSTGVWPKSSKQLKNQTKMENLSK